MKIKYILALLAILAPGLMRAQYASPGDLKITEIMYNPPEAGTDSLEFFEIYNTTNSSIKLDGYTLIAVNLTIPNGTTIAAKGRYVFCTDSLKFYNAFKATISANKTQFRGWKSGALNNSGEAVGIKDPNGKTIDSVSYLPKSPWPVDANGLGSSLTLCDETADNDDPANWSAATEGTGVVINTYEYKASPGAGCTANIVLVSAIATDATHVVLTFNTALNTSSLTKGNYYGLGTLTSITRNTAATEVTLTLASSMTQGNKYTLSISNLKDTTGTLTYNNSVSFYFGNVKNGLYITEINYNCPGADVLEFIEVYNGSAQDIPLGGMYLESAVTGKFPAVTLEPGQFFVMCGDSVNFKKVFGKSAYMWDFGKNLNNTGETIIIKNAAAEVVDSFTYSATAPWPTNPNGTGPSLEQCNAYDVHSASSFAASSGKNYADSAGNTISATPFAGCSGSTLPTVAIHAKTRSCDSSLGEIITTTSPYHYVWSNGDTTALTRPLKTAGTISLTIVNGYGSSTATQAYTLRKLDILYGINGTPSASLTDNTSVPGTKSGITLNLQDADDKDGESVTWTVNGSSVGTGETATTTLAAPKVNADTAYAIVMNTSYSATCTAQVTRTIKVKKVVGLEAAEVVAPSFICYPNPAGSTLNVSFMNLEGRGTLRLLDMNGAILSTQLINAGTIQSKLEMASLATGTYIVEVVSQNGTARKLVSKL